MIADCWKPFFYIYRISVGIKGIVRLRLQDYFSLCECTEQLFLYRVEAIELLLQFEGGSPVVELPPGFGR